MRMRSSVIIFFILLSTGTGRAVAQERNIWKANDSARIAEMFGSADVVTRERMNKGLVMNPITALGGQSAGVNVQSGGADRMAMLSSVRIRGTTSLTGGNDPLVIIDGVSADLATLSTIYPADIESFTILKNAAETAKYGSRGASGVILVTTRKGRGGQFQISYDGNVGLESAYKFLPMLSGKEYASTARLMGLIFNDGGCDTDFERAITRVGTVQSHHVAFSGGSDKQNYRASLGYMNHYTVIKTNRNENFSAKLDLSQLAFDDKLHIDMGVFGSTQKNFNVPNVQQLCYSAATHNPTFPKVRNAQGKWDLNTTASQIASPMALLLQDNDERSLNFNTHLRLTADVMSGLRFGVFGAYSFNSTELAQFLPTWVAAQGQAYRSEHKSEGWLMNAELDYSHTWSVHSLKIHFLGEYQRNRQTGFWTQVRGFTVNDFGYHNLGAGSLRPYGGTGSRYEVPSLASVMANVSYCLMERYTATITTRADGSSMIGRQNRWGVFPSASLEWDVKREMFMHNLCWLSMLKLRLGYGMSGNLGGIGSYNSLRLVGPSGIVPLSGSPTVTMGIVHNANPDLKWETKSTFNIGADMGFVNNRVVLTAEYYYSKTRDMLYLYDVPVPPYTYDKLLANLGSMSNSGFELGMGFTPVQKQDVELNVNVNLSWQRNKLLSLSGEYNGRRMSAPSIKSIGSLNGAGFHGGNNNVVYQIVGQPLGVFYLPHCTGLKRNPDGSYSYEIEDLDKNGEINLEDGGDRRIAGQATPKMTLGSNISFRFKQFDISMQINGAFGHKIYNGTSLSYMNMASFPDYNVMKEAPKQNIKDQTATDYWLESGDYVNFDYVTVGWNVRVKSRFINSLRFSLSINNLATITAYSGLTPIVNSYIVGSTLGIDDKRSFPVYRSYLLSASIQF